MADTITFEDIFVAIDCDERRFGYLRDNQELVKCVEDDPDSTEDDICGSFDAVIDADGEDARSEALEELKKRMLREVQRTIDTKRAGMKVFAGYLVEDDLEQCSIEGYVSSMNTLETEIEELRELLLENAA
jgi:hypothetical protein